MISRRLVPQLNGRRSTRHTAEPTPPPVDDILTLAGDPLQDGGVDLKNG